MDPVKDASSGRFHRSIQLHFVHTVFSTFLSSSLLRFLLSAPQSSFPSYFLPFLLPYLSTFVLENLLSSSTLSL